MKQFPLSFFATWVILAILPVGLAWPLSWHTQPKPQTVEIAPSPVHSNPTAPADPNPMAQSPFSLDNPANQPDYMTYTPYNTFPRELDLWNLEGQRFFQSPVVVSPDKNSFVYTEVIFLPNIRQTISQLYKVTVPALPAPPLPHLPSEAAETDPKPTIDYSLYAARFDPRKTTNVRQSVAKVGFQELERFGFKTLTVVDWSATGKRLLFKERTGILHLGVRTTNLLVYDQKQGTVTIYPEIQRILTHYWQQHSAMPSLDALSWELQPLGWQPGSDDRIVLKAWAYDQKEKKFLGLWVYDLTSERAELLSLTDQPAQVATNGWLVTPAPVPPQPDSSPTLKDRLQHPFGYNKQQQNP